MPAPTFVAEYEVADWNTTTSPKTATATTAAGDILVVLGATEDSTATLGTPTGNSHTYTLRQSVVVTDYCTAYGWTTPATAGTGWTLSVARTGSGRWGFTALRFSGSAGVGTSAKTNVSSGAPSLNITTTQANSALLVIVSDWNAVDGASRTWRTVNGTTPTAGNGLERTYFRNSIAMTAYVAYYPDVGAAGLKTVGLSAPAGQKYSIIAVEVLGTAGGVNHSASATDATPVVDTVAKVVQASRASTDTVTVSDSAVRTAGAVRALTDAVAVSDSATASVGRVTEVVDQIASADAATTQLNADRTLTDTITGADITEVDDGISGGEHSIFGATPYPGTLGLFTDGTPNILLGNAFYTFTEATAGWRCVGARLYIPDGVVQTEPVPVGFWPYAGAGDGPNLADAPARSATIDSPATGWNEVRWTPIEVTPGTPFWIAYDLGGGRYLANTGLTLDPIQAADSASVYLSEGNMSGVGSRAYFRIGAGSTSAGGSTGYGVDLIVDEGSSGGEELLASATDAVSISDSVTAHLHMHHAVADAVTVEDVIATQFDALASIIDPVAVDDTALGRIDFLISITDPVAVDDTSIAQDSKAVEIVDTVAVSDDNSIQAVTFAVEIEDQVGLVDVLLVDESGAIDVTDMVQVSDSISLTQNITLDLIDSIQVADSASQGVDEVRTITSTVNTTDEVTTGDGFVVTLTNSVGVTDDNTNQSVHFSVTPEDDLGVVDSILAQGDIDLDLVDGVSVADSRQVVFVAAEGPNPSRFKAQLLSSRWSARLVLPSRVVRNKLG